MMTATMTTRARKKKKTRPTHKSEAAGEGTSQCLRQRARLRPGSLTGRAGPGHNERLRRERHRDHPHGAQLDAAAAVARKHYLVQEQPIAQLGLAASSSAPTPSPTIRSVAVASARPRCIDATMRSERQASVIPHCHAAGE
jgi:hypothetical protein